VGNLGYKEQKLRKYPWDELGKEGVTAIVI